MTAQRVLARLVPSLRGPVARSVLVGAAKFIVTPLLQELSLEQPSCLSLHGLPTLVSQAPAHAANAASLLPTGELLKSRQLLAIECQKMLSGMCQTVGLQNEAGSTPRVASIHPDSLPHRHWLRQQHAQSHCGLRPLLHPCRWPMWCPRTSWSWRSGHQTCGGQQFWPHPCRAICALAVSRRRSQLRQ